MEDPIPLGSGPNSDRDTLYFLGQIDAKISILLNNEKKMAASIEKQDERLTQRLNKQDERITAVERQSWRMAGMAALIPTIMGLIGLVFTYIKVIGV